LLSCRHYAGVGTAELCRRHTCTSMSSTAASQAWVRSTATTQVSYVAALRARGGSSAANTREGPVAPLQPRGREHAWAPVDAPPSWSSGPLLPGGDAPSSPSLLSSVVRLLNRETRRRCPLCVLTGR
jgi:hypothetical protein